MRVTLGASISLTVTERFLTELRLGRAFSGGQNVAASVGNFSEVQLFVPGGLSPAAIIHRIVLFSTATVRIRMNLFDVAATTFVMNGKNLLRGGADSVAQVRSDTVAVADGTFMTAFPVSANVPFTIPSEWLVELRNGQGVIFNPA